MAIKYRIQFTALFGSGYEHWDFISLTENPGWVTCFHLDPTGAKIDIPVMCYSRENVLSVLKYSIE